MSAFVTILLLFLFGVVITYFFRIRLYFEERLALGGLIGFITFGYILLMLCSFLGLNELSFGLGLLSISGISSLLFRKAMFTYLKEDWKDLLVRTGQRSWLLLWGWLTIFIVWMGILVGNLFTFENGAYYVQPVHSYGDISWHLTLISSFAFGNNFPPMSPIFANGKISYPFMIDFLSSIFINPLGFSYSQAIGLTGIITMTITLISITYFVLRLTKRKLAASLVLPLFLFNGGFGFIYFLDGLQNQNLFDQLGHLTKDYTALKDIGFWWINVVISMLLPQRSFLLGLSMFVLILSIFMQLAEYFQKRLFILGIILITSLPLVHSHTLIALLPFLIFFTLKIVVLHKRPYIHVERLIPITLIGGLGVLLCFLLTRLFLEQSGDLSSIFHVQVGWMAHQENVLTFYVKNFGAGLIIIPLSYLSGIYKDKKLLIISLLALTWFILPSFFLFQPWEFDNTKLFIYWYFASLPLVTFYLSEIFTKKIIGVFLGIIIVFFMVFSGLLDVWRLTTSVNGAEVGTRYQTYSPQAIELSEYAKKNLDPRLNTVSIDKFDNPVVALAGRKTLLGFKGWLWTYGLDYHQTEGDVRDMLGGIADKSLLEQYNVGYIIVFPDTSDYMINFPYLEQNFTLIYQKDGYKIFKI